MQLGAVAPDWLVARTLDDFVGRKLVTITGVQRPWAVSGGVAVAAPACCDESSKQRGLGTLNHEGALEPMLADLCLRFGLPMPDYQHEITLDSCRRRLDFAYPELRIAIEVDGYEFHSRYERFEDDRVRANALELAGWLVLRFTWHELVHRPDRVAATIRQAIAGRAARGHAA